MSPIRPFDKSFDRKNRAICAAVATPMPTESPAAIIIKDNCAGQQARREIPFWAKCKDATPEALRATAVNEPRNGRSGVRIAFPCPRNAAGRGDSFVRPRPFMPSPVSFAA